MKYVLLFTLITSPLFAMHPKNCPNAYENFVSSVSEYYGKCRRDSQRQTLFSARIGGDPVYYTDHKYKQQCERRHLEIALNKYIKECNEQ